MQHLEDRSTKQTLGHYKLRQLSCYLCINNSTAFYSTLGHLFIVCPYVTEAEPEWLVNHFSSYQNLHVLSSTHSTALKSAAWEFKHCHLSQRTLRCLSITTSGGTSGCANYVLISRVQKNLSPSCFCCHGSSRSLSQCQLCGQLMEILRQAKSLMGFPF